MSKNFELEVGQSKKAEVELPELPKEWCYSGYRYPKVGDWYVGNHARKILKATHDKPTGDGRIGYPIAEGMRLIVKKVESQS